MSGRESHSSGFQKLAYLQVPFLARAPRQYLVHELHRERMAGPIASAQHGDHPRCTLSFTAPFGAGDHELVRGDAAIRQHPDDGATGRSGHACR